MALRSAAAHRAVAAVVAFQRGQFNQPSFRVPSLAAPVSSRALGRRRSDGPAVVAEVTEICLGAGVLRLRRFILPLASGLFGIQALQSAASVPTRKRCIHRTLHNAHLLKAQASPAGRLVPILLLALLFGAADPIRGREAAIPHIGAAGVPPEQAPILAALEGGVPPRLGARQALSTTGGELYSDLVPEKGLAEVVVVRDPAVQSLIDLLARGVLERELGIGGKRRGKAAANVDEFAWDPRIFQEDTKGFIAEGQELFRSRWRKPSDRELLAARAALRQVCRLGDGVKVRFVSARAAPVSRASGYMNVFNISPSFPAAEFLSFVEEVPPLRFELRLADAVWLFGHQLHASGQRRAMVVLGAAASVDQSMHDAATVRETLKQLRVPVFFWSFGSGSLAAEWDGRVVVTSADSIDSERDSGLLEDACGELRGELKAQRVERLQVLGEDAQLGIGADGYRPTGRPRDAEVQHDVDRGELP